MDFFQTLQKVEITGLLDGKGWVKLIDCNPRYVPVGRTPEFRIVEAARTSTGNGLKSIKSDNALIRYMFLNKHSSPLEMVDVTILMHLPKAIAIHFLRHRTCSFNEFSQRYAEVPEEFSYFNPLEFEAGIRGSNLQPELPDLMREANQHLDAIHELYRKMLQAGCSREIARWWLPMSEYTTLMIKVNLNNLIKMLTLRADRDHAQLETCIYSEAIIELTEPLFPVTFQAWRDVQSGMQLTATDLERLTSGEFPERAGRGERERFNKLDFSEFKN